MITVEKRTVTRTGLCGAGWRLGQGCVKERLTVSTELWCLCEDGKVISECRSLKIAQRLMDSLTNS
jgi:hypothetical protein